MTYIIETFSYRFRRPHHAQVGRFPLWHFPYQFISSLQCNHQYPSKASFVLPLNSELLKPIH